MSVAESRLQSYFLAQLSIEPGCAVIEANGTMHGDPTARAVFWRQNAGAIGSEDRFVRFGVAGQSDITGVVVGRRVDIEVKTETGRQSPKQRLYQKRIETALGIYIVARELADVMAPVRAMLAKAQR